MTIETFEAFGLAEPLMRAVREISYVIPTPIQNSAIGPQLQKRDLLALAETGSGKTAAFLLPLLQDIALNPISPAPRQVSALILAPTRELALQIDAEVAKLARHLNVRRAVVLGGVGKGAQIQALRRGVHVLVATPGRLLDLVGERHADLSHVKTLVLDEADRMFDMGFIRDIRKIVGLLPKERRNALFSATMPDEIRRLANELLNDPVRVDLSPKQVVVDRIDQRVMVGRGPEKQSRLHTILSDPACCRVIVFTRTKRGADRVADRLGMAGIGAAAIHGNKAQNARQRALRDFSAGHVRVLVATDIAARGIDVSDISHVINFDIPTEPETYVHRIGRTARKGTTGVAISLCDPSERAEIAAIERLMKQRVEVIDDVGGAPVALPPTRPHHEHHRQDKPRGQRRADKPHAQNRSHSGESKRRDDSGRHQQRQEHQNGNNQRRRNQNAPENHGRDRLDHEARSPDRHRPSEKSHTQGRRDGGGRAGGDQLNGTWQGQKPPKFLGAGNGARHPRARGLRPT